MKLESVGLDNIPNVYIDNIGVINTSKMSESGIRTELTLTINDSMSGHWSKDEDLLKYLKQLDSLLFYY